jgi:hypothetical protein
MNIQFFNLQNPVLCILFGCNLQLIGFIGFYILILCIQQFIICIIHLSIFFNIISREPTAFGAIAAHPVEGLLEGNFLIHIIEIIYPFRPFE